MNTEITPAGNAGSLALSTSNPDALCLFKMEPQTISFQCGESVVLVIKPSGEFVVRGKPVPIDDNEGKAVYDAFVEWLKATRTHPL